MELSLNSYNHHKKIRVALVSNYHLILDSMKHLFDSTRDINVTSVNDTKQIFEKPAQIKADVIVIYFEKDDNLELIDEIKLSRPDMKIVVVLNDSSLEKQLLALKYGAAGIVKSEQNFKLLFEAVRQTNKGEVWFNQSLLNRILRQNNKVEKKVTNQFQYSVESITGRETQVIQMIGEGLKNKQIADRLYISEATVRHHLSSIYGKLGVEDRLNLVILAYQQGLIEIAVQDAEI